MRSLDSRYNAKRIPRLPRGLRGHPEEVRRLTFAPWHAEQQPSCCIRAYGWVANWRPEIRNPTIIFVFLVVTGAMVNFDSGGTAAVLVLLGRGCPTEGVPDPHYPCLSEADKGILGAVPFFGLCMGCPLVGHLVLRHGEKHVLMAGLACNVVATAVFACVLNKYWLWLAKFCVGLTQSAICVFSTVWVSKYAPARYKTLWYGLNQSSVAVGTLIGYAVCGYLVEMGVYYQHGFKIQAFWLAITCVLFTLIPSSGLDTRSDPDMTAEHVERGGRWGKPCSSPPAQAESALKTLYGLRGEDVPKESWDVVFQDKASSETPLDSQTQLALLWERPIFLTSMFSLCGVYFVVTAVQYWISQYFIVNFHRTGAEVTTVFIMVAGSAPILGVLSGSAIVDHVGGYETASQMARTSALTVVWGLFAVLAGIVSACVQPGPGSNTGGFYSLVASVWFLLFFGGSALPATTGLSMAAVPKGLRNVASSWSMLLYNILGFASGSYVPGFLAEKVSIKFAMQVVFFSSILSWAFAMWTHTFVSRAVALEPPTSRWTWRFMSIPGDGL